MFLEEQIVYQTGKPFRTYCKICRYRILTKPEYIFSRKEKQDVDDIEAQLLCDNGTKELFIEQNTLEDTKQKELQEYLDAKNKEVKYLSQIYYNMFAFFITL